MVDFWLSSPTARIPRTGSSLSPTVRELLNATGGTGGNLINDAFLAALALRHRAQGATFDNDFNRFPGVEWIGPARPAQPALPPAEDQPEPDRPK
jgi:predicted nucleic acid-binding protein